MVGGGGIYAVSVLECAPLKLYSNELRVSEDVSVVFVKGLLAYLLQASPAFLGITGDVPEDRGALLTHRPQSVVALL